MREAQRTIRLRVIPSSAVTMSKKMSSDQYDLLQSKIKEPPDKPEAPWHMPGTAFEGKRVMSQNVEKTQEKNSVLSPNHYVRWKESPLVFIGENNLDFLCGNIIKYVLRYDAKNGVDDLKKARVYLDALIARTSGIPLREFLATLDGE